jgi:hypothetical protein
MIELINIYKLAPSAEPGGLGISSHVACSVTVKRLDNSQYSV